MLISPPMMGFNDWLPTSMKMLELTTLTKLESIRTLPSSPERR
jgi:hypothetical protein